MLFRSRPRRVSREFRVPPAGRRPIAAIAAAALVLAACGASDDDGAVTPSVAPSTVAEAADSGAAGSNGDVEPVFVPLADGGQLDFNSLRNQDVLLWFWAPW